MLNWDDVRIFLALARGERLTAAAKAAHLDKTTVSRRIARLSEALDSTLFEHYDGGYKLTERGMHFLVYAERVEASILAARESATLRGSAGRVRLGLPEGLGLFLARHAKDFVARHPEIGLDMATGSIGLRPNPSKREAEIAITMVRPTKGAVTIRRLAQASLHLYASRDYLERSPPVESLQDLRRHDLIGYITDPTFVAELDYLSSLGLDLNPSIRAANIVTQCDLVEQGAGIGVIPHMLACTRPNLVQILPREVRLERDLWILVHQDVRDIARVKAVVAWLTQLVKRERSTLYSPRLRNEPSVPASA